MENENNFTTDEYEKNEWDVNKIYDDLDYKNDWLNEKDETTNDNKNNSLYEKLQLDYVSFFNGPKNFHKEQSRRKYN